MIVGVQDSQALNRPLHVPNIESPAVIVHQPHVGTDLSKEVAVFIERIDLRRVHG